MRVRFGDCVLDSDTRQLFRTEKLVHLSPKAFRLLELLLEKRPHAFSKQEIHDAVWPGTFVSEATLARAVSDIRAAIGEDGADRSWIRTVHGFGYAFSGQAVNAEISTPPLGASCFLLWEDKVIPLAPGEKILGRAEDAGIRISDPSVSRHHARLVLGDKATLEDLGSKNGTFVRGSKISQAARVLDKDEIQLGEVRLTFRKISSADSTEPMKLPARTSQHAKSESRGQETTTSGKPRRPR